jgi:hypothetical protein
MGHTDAGVDEETTHPSSSPNEVKFDEIVKALLAEGREHFNLKMRLSRLVMEEAKKHPPRQVMYCASYGQFDFSNEFKAFCHSHPNAVYRDLQVDPYSDRSDPDIIQAISDYGQSICNRFSFILDDMRTDRTWKLNELLSNLMIYLPAVAQGRSTMTNVIEFDPDLVTEGTSFFDQMSNDKGYWREDCLGSFPNGKKTYFGDQQPEINLVAFTEMHPEFWMAHCVGSSFCTGPVTSQIALRFAHVLLRGGDRARYHVEADEAQDAAIYQSIGLRGASKTGSRLAIKEIPALVDYSIDEYDGLETVRCGC